MNVAVVGTGYVGLVAGVCFADAGHQVWGVDRDQNKIDSLKRGEIPIYEPGLLDVFERAQSRLTFTTDLAVAVEACDVIFIAVGTPEREDGSADLGPTMSVVESVAAITAKVSEKKGPVLKYLVMKSTVPVGTAALVRAKIAQALSSVSAGGTQIENQIEVISNPEFLKEGAAVDDFLKPDRVVIGCRNEAAQQIMRDLY